MISCDHARTLARLLQPALRFHRAERSFPFNPDAWIKHESQDTSRGTTLVKFTRPASLPITYPFFKTKSPVPSELNQPDNRAGDVLVLSPFTVANPSPNYVIAWEPGGFKPLVEDWFLCFGGWKTATVTSGPGPVASAQNAGDMDYVHQMIEPLTWSCNNRFWPGNDPLPEPDGIDQVTAPIMWTEVEWAGRYPRLDKLRANHVRNELGMDPSGDATTISEWDGSNDANFGPDPNGAPFTKLLDSYIAITYHMFFPIAARPVVDEPGDPTFVWEVVDYTAPQPYLSPNDAVQEAHWEAVTIFLAVNADPIGLQRDPFGMPDFEIDPSDLETSFDLDRSYIVASRGWSNHQLEEHNASPACVRRLRLARPSGRTGKPPAELLVPYAKGPNASLTPVVYVSFGSHRCAFEATMQKGKPVAPDWNDAYALTISVLGVAYGAESYGEEPDVADFLGFVCSVLPPPLSLVCAFLAFLLSLIISLLQIIALLESILTYGLKGFASLLGARRSWDWPSNEFILCERNGVTLVPAPTGVPLLDPTNTSFSVAAGIKVINRAGYPEVDCEAPTWWNFAGSWGIRVANFVAGWDNAGRRIDPYGRTKAYWNAVALLGARQDGSCEEFGTLSDDVTIRPITTDFIPGFRVL